MNNKNLLLKDNIKLNKLGINSSDFFLKRFEKIFSNLKKDIKKKIKL